MILRAVKPRNIIDDYTGLANGYDQRWRFFNKPVHDWVMAQWPSSFPDGGSVIETGCGTGEILARIEQQYPYLTLTGVDLSPAMLADARKKLSPAVTLIEHNLESDFLKLSASYDVALSLNVLHHLNNQTAHLQTLHNSIEQNGTVFLCDFAINTPLLWSIEKLWRYFHPVHYRAFSCSNLQQRIKDCGFEIKAHDILKPDHFWRLQIYRLEKLS